MLDNKVQQLLFNFGVLELNNKFNNFKLKLVQHSPIIQLVVQLLFNFEYDAKQQS